jgi:hypothetical protein
MVSVVESFTPEQQALAEANRAAAAPFVEYPPTPWWFFPGAGAWAAAMVLTATGARDTPAVFLPALAALIGVELAFFTWYRRYRGTSPTLKSAPPEIAREMRRYFVGVGVVAAVVVVTVFVANAVVAAGVAFVLVTAGLVVYERRYEAAVREIRARLA